MGEASNCVFCFRGPNGWGVQVDEGSKCVFDLRGPSGWGVQVCVCPEGSKWVGGPIVCLT